MRILFVENKYRTLTWAVVAEHLKSQGHEISWLVQNHWFKPKTDTSYVLPYPPRFGKRRPLTAEMERIAASDRLINHYGGNANHYPHYLEAIRRVFDRARPDVVFGEATLFHELMTIETARDRGIPYLHPSVCRIPTGRFSFYQYETMTPFGGEGRPMPEEEVDHWIDLLAKKKSAQEYMRIPPPARRTKALMAYRSIGSWLGGERFNGPSPTRKFRLERNRRGNLVRWEALAARPRLKPAFRVLFPLQLVPEANIDVWGRVQRDQLRLLKAVLAATPSDVGFLVKPNPKSKAAHAAQISPRSYELSDDLLELVRSEPRLVPLPHDTPMDSVFWDVDLIMTVTGTVQFEAAFAGRPVVNFAETMANATGGCLLLPSPEALAGAIELVRAGKFPIASRKARAEVLDRTYRTSYPGMISDPLNTPSALTPDNRKKIAVAFDDVVSQVERHWGAVARTRAAS